MIIVGLLLIAGALIDCLLTGFSTVDLTAALTGICLMLMKTPLGKKILTNYFGINMVLSRLVIIAVALAVIVVPLSFVQGKGSRQSLNKVLKNCAELVERGEYDQAYQLLDDFEGENIPEIMQNKATVLIRKGESQEAEALLSQASALKNMDAGMLFNLGLIYFQSKRYEEAAESFEKAVLLEPEMWLGCYYAGEAYYRNKNYRSAEYFYAEALQIVPDNPRIYYSLAQSKMKKMEFAEALTFIEKAKNCPAYSQQRDLAVQISKLEDEIKDYPDLKERFFPEER